MNYPDYDTLREQYEAGNISAVDFVIQQSPEITEDYNHFSQLRSRLWLLGWSLAWIFGFLLEYHKGHLDEGAC